MIIDCVSDLHGHYPKLDGGDLLIVAGDLTGSDRPYQYEFLYDVLKEKAYKKIIIIAGNHDNCLQNKRVIFEEDDLIKYLCDSGIEFEGLKIWGSPWTTRFEGMNPHCMAFTVDTDEELAEKWNMIPDGVDILVTHSPPYGMLDKNMWGESCGSMSLGLKIAQIEPSLVVFGHIHEQGSRFQKGRNGTILVNASHVNEHYQPVNDPIRIAF